MGSFLTIFIKTVATVLSVLVSCTFLPPNDYPPFNPDDPAAVYESRARMLADSYYANYFCESGKYLKQYNVRPESSGCWDLTAMLTVMTKVSAFDAGYVKKADTVLKALSYYSRVENGMFYGYTGGRASHPFTATSGVYYDDNMWIGRDLVELYKTTGHRRYLDAAFDIADMLIRDGYTDLDPVMFFDKFGVYPAGAIGGFYWNYAHDALHTCSNAPAVQFLAALSAVADNGKAEEYIDYAIKSYRFLKYLERSDGVFHDLMRFHKGEGNVIVSVAGPDGPPYSYNSGAPMTAAVELYEQTGEAHYLDDAKRWAACADAYFARDTQTEGLKSYTDLVWFREILLNGYAAVVKYDPSVLPYIQNMENSVNHAYDRYRMCGVFCLYKGFLPTDWVNGYAGLFSDDRWLPSALSQIPHAGIYATLAEIYRVA